MFKKFGELTLEELNQTAAGFKDECDIKSLKALAKEWNLDSYDVKDYINGDIDTLATNITAAMGKIEAEYREIEAKNKGYKLMPYTVIKNMVISDIAEIADNILIKNRRMEDIYKAMEKEMAQSNGCICGTDAQLKKIIEEYYSKGKVNVKKILGVE